MICKKYLITSIFNKLLKFIQKLFLFSGIAFLFLINGDAFAQQQNETLQFENKKDSVKHSPTKAALYSAILPGLGQVYNKKYWKLPIIYGGLIGLGYSIGVAQQSHMNIRKEYVHRIINQDERNDPKYAGYDTSLLPSLAEDSRKLRDLLVIGTAAVYLLQVVDASVDAHLFTFDVSDDLSFNLQPDIKFLAFNGQTTGGLALRIKF
jgi:hypothetical protein